MKVWCVFFKIFSLIPYHRGEKTGKDLLYTEERKFHVLFETCRETEMVWYTINQRSSYSYTNYNIVNLNRFCSTCILLTCSFHYNYLFLKYSPFSIDATEESSRLGRLVSHDITHPNCKPKQVVVRGQPRLLLEATKQINIHDEVKYDYGNRSFPMAD